MGPYQTPDGLLRLVLQTVMGVGYIAKESLSPISLEKEMVRPPGAALAEKNLYQS